MHSRKRSVVFSCGCSAFAKSSALGLHAKYAPTSERQMGDLISITDGCFGTSVNLGFGSRAPYSCRATSRACILRPVTCVSLIFWKISCLEPQDKTHRHLVALLSFSMELFTVISSSSTKNFVSGLLFSPDRTQLLILWGVWTLNSFP